MPNDAIRAIFLALVTILSVMTAGVALSSTAAASHGGDAIVVDDDGGADFQTLQAAVDHADDGDVIEIRAGTYSSVDVDENVSLLGVDGPADTVIEGASDNAILLQGHTDELGDIEVRGLTLRSSDGAGLIAFSDGSTDFDTDGLVVSNVVVDGAAFGIYVFDARNVEITNSRIQDVDGAGVSMAGVEDVTIDGNEIVDSGSGVAVGVGNPESVYPSNADVRVGHNDIEGNDVGVVNEDDDLTVDATDNYWGHASGPGGDDGRTNPAGMEVGKGDDVEGDVDFDPWLRRSIGHPSR